MKSSMFTSILLILIYFSPSLSARTLTYFGGDNKSYNYEILVHALSYHANSEFEVVIYPGLAPKQRVFEFLTENNGIDVVFGGATIERELQNHPIRIPLLKGLNGWRIPLVHLDNALLLKNQPSTAAFKQLLAGQFHLWSDVKILEANKVKVHKATNSEGIYQMLDKKRFDYFPRSVLEVWGDYKRHSYLNIMVEEHTLLHYPTAYYFYVNKTDFELIRAITEGLEAAIKDGSFDALFEKHYGDTIQKATQNKRTVHVLRNPLLSPHTPIDRSELWIDLSKVDKSNNQENTGANITIGSEPVLSAQIQKEDNLNGVRAN